MKNLPYLLIGIVFGLALTKGEAISWYRMQEMFHFQGFHMYGIFITAVPVGALSIFLMTKLRVHAKTGEPIQRPVKQFRKGYVFGGMIFGFGWALTGTCPGPIYAQIGAGYLVTLAMFVAALMGTWAYAYLRPWLPD